MNGVISETQYPDHNPVIVNLATRNSHFRPNDIKSYNWHKISDEIWEDLCTDLNAKLRDDIDNYKAGLRGPLFENSQSAMDYMNKEFLRVRSKYLSKMWRKVGSKPFFDFELRDLKARVKACRRKVFRLKRRKSQKNKFVAASLTYKQLRLQYGKMYDSKRKTFEEKLEEWGRAQCSEPPPPLP